MTLNGRNSWAISMWLRQMDEDLEAAGLGASDLQEGVEIMEEQEFKLAAGLHEIEHDVVCGVTCRAHRAAGDLALGYASPDVVL